MVRHEAAEALGGIIEEEIDEGHLDPKSLTTTTQSEEGLKQGDEDGDGAKAMRKMENQERELIQRVVKTLKEFSKDMDLPRVVRESCVVALDEMACEF